MDMINDIVLFLANGIMALSCIWLSVRRDNFQRVVYLLLSLVFALFMISIWPGYEASNQFAFILLLFTTGVQIIGHALIEKLKEKGFDVIHGKLIDE